jgi:hypothetical protein
LIIAFFIGNRLYFFLNDISPFTLRVLAIALFINPQGSSVGYLVPRLPNITIGIDNDTPANSGVVLIDRQLCVAHCFIPYWLDELQGNDKDNNHQTTKELKGFVLCWHTHCFSPFIGLTLQER